jgi:hypothetical protein
LKTRRAKPVVLVVNFASIVYMGLGGRRLSLTIAFFFTGISYIILSFANLYRWSGFRDTLSSTGCNGQPPPVGLPFLDPSFLDALYLSIITWTTVGYGDLVPCAGSRWISAAEALMGYLVMALLISAVVSSIEKLRGRRP